MSKEDIEDAQFEPEPHPSGVSHIKISMWTGGDAPGNALPAESVSVPVRAGERYAADGQAVDAETWLVRVLTSHLRGECDCLEADTDG